MRPVLAADGSSCTKKALSFRMAHEGPAGRGGEVVALHAQAPVTRTEEFLKHVMGTDGHGPLGRALMGSVEQDVLGQPEIPVLLVK